MPYPQPPTRRFAPNLWYSRVPCDPPPDLLAQRLAEAKVADKAAKRIDTYERFHHQHVEHSKLVVRTGLGALGLVLSVSPIVPGLVQDCREGLEKECALRIVSMVGAALALCVTFWSSWEVYRTPSKLSEHIAKLNEELERAMHAKNGEAPVTRLFDIYRSMSRKEQIEFKAYLHERAKAPRTEEAAQRAAQLAGGATLSEAVALADEGELNLSDV